MNLTANQIHVVSLSTATERREHISRLFASHRIPFSYFDAVHGRNSFGDGNWPWFYDPEYMEKKVGSRLSYGDLGCAASHISLWERLVASNDDAWIIFEDDIVLSNTVNAQALEEVADKNGVQGITLLNHVSIFGYRAGRIFLPLMGGEARFPIWGNMFTGAYAIGREAASKLLTHLRNEKLWHSIDTWGSYRNRDWGYCHLVPLRVVLPPPAWQSFAFTSSITAMGRDYVHDDSVNQSGRIRWRSQNLLRSLWFWIRGHLESLCRPASLPLNQPDQR